MKKGIMLILCLLVTVILSCLTSCEKLVRQCEQQKQEDVVTIVDEGTFVTVVDAMCEQERLRNDFNRDSVFRAMDDQTTANIVTVLLRRQGCCTIQDIVDEYSAHKDIYDNLVPLPETTKPKQEEAKAAPSAKTEPDTVKQLKALTISIQ